ncbi:hypothetical protein EB001_13560 [bacterium]|jgi:hypothetical protein|nr:hypothetical protein [bacterium]
MAENKVIINETINEVVISSPGPQGPRGKSILNGVGAPAENFGTEGDFYYDKSTTRFYGPKLSDTSWAGAINYILNMTLEYSWELTQVTGPVSGIYSVVINHNLGMKPNVTVKSSAGDVLETGIDYNSNNTITLTMAQPFSGTAYLS